MNRTRVVAVAVLSAATLWVVVSLVWRTIAAVPTLPIVGPFQPSALRIQVVTAQPVEPWVSAAAEAFNGAGHRSEGRRIVVEVLPMDGLVALGQMEENAFGARVPDGRAGEYPQETSAGLSDYPVAWIADSSFLVEMANTAYAGVLGRDVFLSDGQYRVRPLAQSLLTWGFFRSRGAALFENMGPISWSTVNRAGAAPTGWKELGGDASWGHFSVTFPDPRKNTGGLAVLMGVAGEYYQRTTISIEDVTDAGFQEWLTELTQTATDLGGGNANSAAALALFGYSAGDGGQFLESDLLNSAQGMRTRWQEFPILLYPEYTTWFDFPFAIWVGPETSALEKSGALAFQSYLLSEAEQRKAVEFGLRPVTAGVMVHAGDDSLTADWEKLGMEWEVPNAEAMLAPSRDVVLALLRWYELNATP